MPFVVLVLGFSFRSLKPTKYPHSKRALIVSSGTAVLFCCVGTYWWYFNFPEHLDWFHYLTFCVIPGFVIGACLYAIVVKSNRAINDVLAGTKNNSE